MPELLIDNFGGLNLLDNPEPNEAVEMSNVHVDRNGRVRGRLGYSKDGAMSAFAANINGVYDWDGTIIVQEGVNVRRRTGAGSFSLVKAFTTSDRVQFATFPTGTTTKLLMLHEDDGLFTWDGSTVTGPHGTFHSTNASQRAIAVWQNKVWVTGFSQRLYFCAPGDETNWTTNGAGTVDIAEAHGGALLGLVVSPRVGLLAAKNKATYRIIDSSTGEYVTIDPTTGLQAIVGLSHRGWAALDEYVVLANGEGVWVSDGASPFQNVSRKLDPLFTARVGEATRLIYHVSALADERAYIGFTDQSLPGITIEFDPKAGTFSTHSFWSVGMALVETATAKTYFHVSDLSTERFLWQTFDGGTDNGAAINCVYELPEITLIPGRAARIHRLRVEGHGPFNVDIAGATVSSGFLTVGWNLQDPPNRADFWIRRKATTVSPRITASPSSEIGETMPASLNIGNLVGHSPFELRSLLLTFDPLGVS